MALFVCTAAVWIVIEIRQALPGEASIEAASGVSKGTIAATRVSTFAILPDNRKCYAMRQGQDAIDIHRIALRSA